MNCLVQDTNLPRMCAVRVNVVVLTAGNHCSTNVNYLIGYFEITRFFVYKNNCWHPACTSTDIRISDITAKCVQDVRTSREADRHEYAYFIEMPGQGKDVGAM